MEKKDLSVTYNALNNSLPHLVFVKGQSVQWPVTAGGTSCDSAGVGPDFRYFHVMFDWFFTTVSELLTYHTQNLRQPLH